MNMIYEGVSVGEQQLSTLSVPLLDDVIMEIIHQDLT